MTYRLHYMIWAILWCALVNPRATGQDAQLAKKINAAIDKGVKYLKDYVDEGSEGRRPGVWSLWGWTLLESGVPVTDATVQKLAGHVRQAVVRPIWETYDLALGIIFLDKLGDAGDQTLLESLAVRLRASQTDKGGWTYQAYHSNAAEGARLLKDLDDANRLRKLGLAIKSRPRSAQEAHRDVERQTKALESSAEFTVGDGDNSNTQFAMLALWVARRHGIPVDKNLTRLAARFRETQVKGGHWDYAPGNPRGLDSNYYPSMTCAGLLGLALGQGVEANPKDLSKDAQVQSGLDVLAGAMDPNFGGGTYLYFLFSLERMAVVYNIKKIGAHDWYLWGAQKLVNTQGADGSWADSFPGDGVDTCFALLFLKRANVAPDLTEILQSPLRKGLANPNERAGIKKPEPRKTADDLFEPPKLTPKEAPKQKAPPQSWLDDSQPGRVGQAYSRRPIGVYACSVGRREYA